MNYYKNDTDAYFCDKAQIFLHQEAEGVLVTTRDVFERAQQLMRKLGKEFEQEVRLVDASLLPEDCILAMPGEHNRLNAALATEALRATGLIDEEIFEGLASFPGVSGRLEYLGMHNGAKIYNDNNATTPSATIEGLKAVADGKNVILIAGGADKNITLEPLIDAIQIYTKKVILLPGTGTERLRELIEDNIAINRDTYVVCENLEEAFEAAIASATSGDVLLFSPGFASFGTFTNEYDRNDQFVALVRQLL
jgi:UDP-N-acetylmuramoylalanine--D-glutamate ligase